MKEHTSSWSCGTKTAAWARTDYCTVRKIVPVTVVEPDVPVMAIVYCPDVVPELPPPMPVPLPDPPHADTPPAIRTARTANSIRFRHKRRRKGTNQRTTQVNTGAAVVDQRIHGPGGSTSFAELAAVVVNVNVELTALNSRRFTEAGVSVTVGKSCAPAGLAVIAAVRATVPRKPFIGVTVMAEVLDD